MLAPTAVRVDNNEVVWNSFGGKIDETDKNSS